MVHCAYIKRRPILSSNPFPWEWRIYIPSIVYVNKPCIFDSKYFCVFVGGWTAKIGGVEYLFFMKVKISQSIFEALSGRIKNDEIDKTEDDSFMSKVYLSDKYVKKIAKKGEYPYREILQYKVMEKHPDIFPKTVVRELKNEKIVIVQEKLDTGGIKNIFDSVEKSIKKAVGQLDAVGELDASYLDFVDESILGHRYLRLTIQALASYNMSKDVEKNLEKIINKIDKNGDEIELHYFQQFLEIARELYKIKNKVPDLNRFDSHYGNFGVDGNGNIKVFDFASPFSTALKTPKEKLTHKEEIDNYDNLSITPQQAALLFSEKFGLGFFNPNLRNQGEELFSNQDDFKPRRTDYSYFLDNYLTSVGKRFVDFLEENIEKKYVRDTVSDYHFMVNKNPIKKIFDSYFPSKNAITKKQVLHFLENFMESEIQERKYKTFKKDMFGSVSPSIQMSQLDNFFEELSKFGLPINMVEAKK